MTEPYPWKVIGQASLTSIPDPNGGKDVVAHLFATSNIVDTISVGILDPVSKTFSIRSNWTLVSSRQLHEGGAEKRIPSYGLSGE